MTDTAPRPRRKAAAFDADERAAMRERAREAAAPGTADGERAVLDKIAELPEADRALAEQLHRLILQAAPTLAPRTWYGMPAYARDGKVLCFFQPASKFKARYATLGFSDGAALDEGTMWPTAFALRELGAAEQARVLELVRRAAAAG
ncbi:iron chaperone [Rubrivivax gelatinosus]|uniref:Uncharacterized protein n=1 Tax=Rubrivivax gelatinosus (strain NBRC 100245 / IL144) TaxID=983917 RepID=I0HRF1_RUBGI|nr:DUF1801 domain-containing protein [Rubrivivax gelatinosus]BAL95588.1 hypothetical protein RGE_22470 [Rubrivivax gelatinosus IL144]